MSIDPPSPGDHPVTSFTPRQERILKIAVVVMGIMLVVGFLVIVATIVSRASRMGQKGEARERAGDHVRGGGAATSEEVKALLAPGAPFGTLPVPHGARVVSATLSGDRLVLVVEDRGGSSVMIVDQRTMQPVGALRLQGEAAR